MQRVALRGEEPRDVLITPKDYSHGLGLRSAYVGKRATALEEAIVQRACSRLAAHAHSHGRC